MTDACTAAYERLVSMIREAEVPSRERTIEDEGRMAMEDMILELEGSEALVRYQCLWASWGSPR